MHKCNEVSFVFLVPLAAKIQQIPSRILFKRLLNKIRSQKSLWTIKSVSEDEGEVTSSIIEIESKVPSVDSGAIITEERTAASFEQEQGAFFTTLSDGTLVKGWMLIPVFGA